MKIEKTIFFPSDTLEDIKVIIRKKVAENGNIDVKTLRNELGNSRKFAIAILEYFDNTKVTIRVGDKRILRGSTG